MPGLLTLIGSGEVSAGMVRVHRRLLALTGASDRLAFLDTPAGFEFGAEAIAPVSRSTSSSVSTCRWPWRVCRIYDAAEADGHHFLSMEYVDGEDLASLLRRIGRLPKDKAIEIARQLCAGLAASHQIGLLHRDLKPANIMLDGRGRARITDFGLASLSADAGHADLRSGTPDYMAPEQLAGREVTVRSDSYALGLVLYELFSGKPAFRAVSVDELRRLQSETTPSSPSSYVEGFDPTVERVLLRCRKRIPRADPPLSRRASIRPSPT